jgi:hypothetical protein
MDMTYDHASNIVKTFGKGNLLTGLKWMKMEMETVDDKGYPIWLTNAQVAAYRIVMNEMRKLVG